MGRSFSRRLGLVIDTVFLDADGVLQFPGPGFKEHFERLLDGSVSVEDLFRTEETTIDGSRDLRDVLAEFIAKHDLAATPDDLIDGWYNIVVNRADLTLVDELRARGVRCYLTTNQQAYRGSFIQRTLGYEQHFDRQFYSFELGVAKPSAEFFAMVLAQTEADPSRTLFIDDLPANVEAARALGLQAEVHRWQLGMPIPSDDVALREIFRRYGLPV